MPIAHFFLNYNKVLDSQIGVVLGPNRFDEYLTVVTQDVKDKRTRLGLAISHKAAA